MNLLQLISHRESIRSYDPSKPVSKDVLLQILEAGRLAPSAANLQPWQFIMVSSLAKLAEVRETYPRAWFADAPHVLIVVGNKEKTWKRADGYNSIETDLTIAMDHLILAAESQGVGTCWIANFDYQALRSVLQLAENEVVFALTPLGYPKEGFEKKGLKIRKPLPEVVKYI
ncbi:MAG: nitroreductase family protein [Paludibacter sp.]